MGGDQLYDQARKISTAGGAYIENMVINVTPPTPVQPSHPKAVSRASIELRIKGTVATFDVNTLINALSGMLNVAPQEISVVQVAAGSVWVRLEMPLSAAQWLYHWAYYRGIAVAHGMSRAPGVSPRHVPTRGLTLGRLLTWVIIVVGLIVAGVVAAVIISRDGDRPSPPEPPSPQVSFTADPAIEANCKTVRWEVEGAQEVYYEGERVDFHGYRVECPMQTTTYHLWVVGKDGSETEHRVTIEVEPIR